MSKHHTKRSEHYRGNPKHISRTNKDIKSWFNGGKSMRVDGYRDTSAISWCPIEVKQHYVWRSVTSSPWVRKTLLSSVAHNHFPMLLAAFDFSYRLKPRNSINKDARYPHVQLITTIVLNNIVHLSKFTNKIMKRYGKPLIINVL